MTAEQILAELQQIEQGLNDLYSRAVALAERRENEQ